MSATVNGNKITITAASNTMVADDIQFAAAYSLAYTESAVGATTELTSKVTQYENLMTQLDNLKGDAFYKGKNLLGGASGGTYDMTVRFGNNHTLTVSSFDGSRSGLSLDTTLTTTSEATLQASIDKLDTAVDTLRSKASELSSNLSITNIRDEWISNIAQTLQTGADKLTLADANEEGANMLMLQTRQSISTSALSMASQAAQSVLRLFQ
jgi:flagellin-like hook-associated protein FlgL